jgi:hypothetical protein
VSNRRPHSFSWLALALLVAAGCGGSRRTSPPAPAALVLAPAAPILAVGQSVQFSAALPPGVVATWSVEPAYAGLISPAGAFTAANSPGSCTVRVSYGAEAPYGAIATVTILPAPAPATSTPGQEQASGRGQTQPGTGAANVALVGEVVPVTNAISADPAVQVRHGFLPPGL